MSTRRPAVFFVLRVALPYTYCANDSCRALLVGRRCWHWMERGALRASCCVCWPAKSRGSEAA